MAESKAFEKIHVDERDKGNLEGLLEQLNLPPSLVAFVREHKRAVQLVAAAVIVTVVIWALYDSYRENRIHDGVAALAEAMDKNPAEQIEALATVTEDFSGTPAALWAGINRGKALAEEGRSPEALSQYQAVRREIDEDSALYPLIVAAMAQLYEREKRYDEAVREYQVLQQRTGYESLGYLGIGRVHELQDNRARALEVYQEFLNQAAGTLDQAQRYLVEEKIARLKTVP